MFRVSLFVPRVSGFLFQVSCLVFGVLGFRFLEFSFSGFTIRVTRLKQGYLSNQGDFGNERYAEATIEIGRVERVP